ncbi:amidohydrolase [Cellulomonas sp. Marseille-Q8402]
MTATGPTTLLRHARLLGASGTSDVLVAGGRVARVAPGGSSPSPGGAAVVDLAGRTLMPGLWDAHVHLTQWVVRRERLDLTPATSGAATLDLVRAASPTWPGELLVGYGFRDALWPDVPTRAALDQVAAGRPVVLISLDLHCGWLSAAAAALLGVQRGPDGMLREGPWIAALDVLDGFTRPADAAYREAALAAARRGVVGVVELENADNATDWPRRVAAGVDALRVEASVWPDRLDQVVARGLRSGDVLDPTGLVTMGPLKVVVDGSLNTRTAWCWDPYPGLAADHPHPCGLPAVAPEELDGLLATATAHGIRATVHAIGDRAAARVLDAFERLGPLEHPGTIEHAQLVTRADVARFARLGLVASVQPEHAVDDRDVADRYWPGRTDRAFAYGSLHAAGVPLRLGSDAPVSPLDPWHAVAAAVRRTRDEQPPWHPEQQLPLDVALAASVRGPLRVGAGDLADLVVLDADPLTAAPEVLRAMPVAATAVAGRWTWNALDDALDDDREGAA